MSAARFGATWLILERRYSCSSSRYPARDTTRSENLSMLIRSMGEMSMPGGGNESVGVNGEQNVKVTPSRSDCGLFLPTGSAMTVCVVTPGL